MFNVKKNDYNKNQKQTDIMTPPGIAKYIYDQVAGKISDDYIFDPAAGDGALLVPFAGGGYKVTGLDIYNDVPELKIRKGNFLEVKKLNDPPLNLGYKEIGLITCNPPWNRSKLNPETLEYLKKNRLGNALLPWLFLQKLYDVGIPLVMIAPWGLLQNQWRASSRQYELSAMDLRWRVILPIDSFPNPGFNPNQEISVTNQPSIAIQSEILFFNIDPENRHIYIPDAYLDMERPRNVAK